ncbi:MAG: hypothetical protein ABI429_05555 [Jatrophihabitantaceae bacterium]
MSCRSAASHWVSWARIPLPVVEQSWVNGVELHSMLSEMMCHLPML